MLNKLRERAQSEKGFTLIELLVVMLIIGLLAAIAIPSFFNQRDKANDADAKEQVRTAQTAAETYATDNNGSYTGISPDELIEVEAVLSDVPAGDLAAAATDGGNGYTVSVTATDTDNVFTIARSGAAATEGQLTYSCDTDGTGGCPDDGNWE